MTIMMILQLMIVLGALWVGSRFGSLALGAISGIGLALLVFGFGLHPAFNCPLDKEKSFSDYRVEFECEDVEGSVLPLSYELFEQYPTYVIHDPKSRRFTLTDGENSVILETEEGFHIFALWTPKAPFVCLEPWVNTLDDEPEIRVFENAKGNIVLNRGEEYRIGYRFAIV